MTDNQLEELADIVVDDFRSFIHNEERFIQEAHELKDQFIASSHVLRHLSDLLSSKHPLVSVYRQIMDAINVVLTMLDRASHQDLMLVQEEEGVVRNLETDLKHLKWKAIKKDMSHEIYVEKEAIELETHELVIFHREFEVIVDMLEDGSLKPYLHSRHLRNHMPKEDHESDAVYYCVHLYKMFKSYEEIFRGLVVKESRLNRKAEGTAEKIDKKWPGK